MDRARKPSFPAATVVVIPMLVGIAIVTVEHFGDIINHVESGKTTLSKIATFTVCVAASIATVGFGVKPIETAVRSSQNFREDYSFYTILVAASLFLITSLCWLGFPAPWHLPGELKSIYLGTESADTGSKDAAILTLLLFVLYLIGTGHHSKWRGLKSENQGHDDSQGVTGSLTTDFWRECERRIKGHGERSRYIAHGALAPTLAIDDHTPARSWRDQAFDIAWLLEWIDREREFSWHPSEQLWVGQSRLTQETVAIHPCDNDPGDTGVDRLLAIILSLRKRKKKSVEVLIVFCRDSCEIAERRINGITVRKISPNHLVSAISYGTYFSYIKTKSEIDTNPSIGFSADGKYVPLDVVKEDGTRLDLDKYVHDWVVERSDRQIALLGDYGQGKSTFALHWTRSQIQALSEKKTFRVPILMELRGKSPRNLGVDDLFGAWAAQHGLNGKLFSVLHELGNTVLILDGFDEMALVGSSEARFEHFRSLWQSASQHAKVLITGRPNLFFDTSELKLALNVRRSLVQNSLTTETVKLLPFSMDKIKAFLADQDPKTRKEILSAAKTNASFRELVSRPSLLRIATGLWKKEHLATKVRTLTSASILKLFVNNCFERQDEKQKRSPVFMILTTEEREFFMDGVAAFMAANQKSNQIRGRDLQDCVDKLLKVIPESVGRSERMTLTTAMPSGPLRTRYADRTDLLAIVVDDVKTCGLLVTDPTLEGAFKFGHKSFLDYLVAKVLYRQIFDVNSLWYKTINRATQFGILTRGRIQPSLGFLSDMIRTRATDHGGFGDEVDQVFKGLFGPSVLRVFSHQIFYASVLQSPPYSLDREGKRSLESKIMSVFFAIFMTALTLSFGILDFSWILILGSAVIFFFASAIALSLSEKLSLWLDLATLLGVDVQTQLKYLRVPNWAARRYRFHRPALLGTDESV